MSATAFNRSRRQAADQESKAKGKDNPLSALAPEETSNYPDGYNLGPAEPPYPEVRKMFDVPSEFDFNRELEAAKESELNRVRVLSEESRENIQNAHKRSINAGYGLKIDREEDAQKKSLENRTRLLSRKEREKLQNAHLLDAETVPQKGKTGFVPVKYNKQEEEAKIAESGENRVVPQAEVADQQAKDAEETARKEVQAKAKSPPPPPPPVETLPQASSNSEVNKDYATKPADAPKTVQPGPVPGTKPKDK
jgi:hypothetical protein